MELLIARFSSEISAEAKDSLDTVSEVFGNPTISMRLQVSQDFDSLRYKELQATREVTLISA